MPLEDFYAGDDHFHQFAMACEPEWANCDCQDRLLQTVGGDLDLAIALHYHLGERVFDWMKSPNSALDGLAPKECLETTTGRRRLKECLWRMP